MIISKRSALIFGGVAAGAAVVVGVCMYLDRKRRHDPNYKEKLRQRRTKEAFEKHIQLKTGGKSRSSGDTPKFKEDQERQAYFFQQVQLGEEFLASGDMENAVDHLYQAIVLCGAPTQLINVFRETMPPQAFSLLAHKLENDFFRSGPSASNEIVSS